MQKSFIPSKTSGIAIRRMNFKRTYPPFKNIYISDVLVPVLNVINFICWYYS